MAVKYYENFDDREISEKDAKSRLGEYYCKYDSTEEALADIRKIKKPIKLDAKHLYEMDKIITPIYHKGVKLDMYFEWDGSVFGILMGYVAHMGDCL